MNVNSRPSSNPPSGKKKNRLWWVVAALVLIVIFFVAVDDNGIDLGRNPISQEYTVSQSTQGSLGTEDEAPGRSTTRRPNPSGSQAGVAAASTSRSSRPSSTTAGRPTPTKAPATTADIRDLGGVPANLRQHYYFQPRNIGNCEKLVGKVTLGVVFVTDPDSSWSNSQMDRVKASFIKDTDRLMAEAGRYNKSLSISYDYYTATVDHLVGGEGSGDWLASVFSAAGLPNKGVVQTQKEAQAKVDAYPFIFVINREGRAYASTFSSGKGGLEYAVVYNEDDLTSFDHELLHIFGAKDLYYPQLTKTTAQRYLEGSIMLDSSKELVDDYTAFMIGWRNDLSASAKSFLEGTASLTAEYVKEQNELELMTGYGTKAYGSGTYTGDLVRGVPHGQGKHVCDDYTYEGSWDNGNFHGQGTLTWSNGSTYTGSFVKGQREGYGVIRWYTGNRYEGNWKNSKRHGKGVQYYNDGGKYEGNWKEDFFHGQGTFTWKDGAVYTGNWVEGERQGQGELVLADGARYKGEFYQSKQHGTGTYTWKDGTVYTGKWVEGERRGYGAMTWKDGTRYEGEFYENQRHGTGTYTWPDGTVYTGDWDMGNRTGQGTLRWSSGNSYTGGFLKGELHGEGTYKYSDGKVVRGVWENGKRVKTY